MKRSRHISIFIVGLLLLYPGTARAEDALLNRNLTVGVDHQIKLKAHQVVRVMKISGTNAVILVSFPDGSSGIYQIDATALEPVPTAPPPTITPPATNSPAAVVAPPTAPPLTTNVPPAAPVDPNLPEDQVTLIHVTWPEDTKAPPPYANDYSAKAGSYSYRLYLPPGYYAHPEMNYPTLFIMSPGGDASLGAFQQRAREEGWIVIMFVEAKNGDWGPILGDMMATHADVIRKVRIQEGCKFATGFSGGARGTSLLTQLCPGFNGELLQGAAFPFDDNNNYEVGGIPRDHPYAVFLAMGSDDSNLHELDDLRKTLHGIPYQSTTFPGGHQEAPVTVVNEGLDWLMEQMLLKDSLSNDLHDCGVRNFGFLAKRWENAPESAKKIAEAKLLIAVGESLDFPAGTAEALELAKIKDSVPLTP